MPKVNLSREIVILLLAFAVDIAGSIWWASGINTKVGTLEGQLTKQIEAYEQMPVQMAVAEEKITQLNCNLEKLSSQLERMNDRMDGRSTRGNSAGL